MIFTGQIAVSILTVLKVDQSGILVPVRTEDIKYCVPPACGASGMSTRNCCPDLGKFNFLSPSNSHPVFSAKFRKNLTDRFFPSKFLAVTDSIQSHSSPAHIPSGVEYL